MEDSNLTQSSYNIIVEEGLVINYTYDDVEEAPPQLRIAYNQPQMTRRYKLQALQKIHVESLLVHFLHQKKRKKYFKLFIQFDELLFHCHTEMLGNSPRIAIHHLVVKIRTCSIKKYQRVFLPELVAQIEAEVHKLIEERFIQEVKYPLWISNIILSK